MVTPDARAALVADWEKAALLIEARAMVGDPTVAIATSTVAGGPGWNAVTTPGSATRVRCMMDSESFRRTAVCGDRRSSRLGPKFESGDGVTVYLVATWP